MYFQVVQYISDTLFFNNSLSRQEVVIINVDDSRSTSGYDAFVPSVLETIPTFPHCETALQLIIAFTHNPILITASQSQLFKRRADSVTGNEIGPRHKRSISNFRSRGSLPHNTKNYFI